MRWKVLQAGALIGSGSGDWRALRSVCLAARKRRGEVRWCTRPKRVRRDEDWENRWAACRTAGTKATRPSKRQMYVQRNSQRQRKRSNLGRVSLAHVNVFLTAHHPDAVERGWLVGRERAGASSRWPFPGRRHAAAAFHLCQQLFGAAEPDAVVTAACPTTGWIPANWAHPAHPCRPSVVSRDDEGAAARSPRQRGQKASGTSKGGCPAYRLTSALSAGADVRRGKGS